MARGVMAITLSLVVVAMLMAQQTSAQSGCTTEIVSLAPCLNFITGNTSTPTSSCCSALSSVVQTKPQCLCAVLGGATSSFGVTINNTKALELPGSCNVQTPPVSKCNAVGGGPAASPTATPTPATPSTPSSSSKSAPETQSTPSVPSDSTGTTSKTTTETSAGSSNKLAVIPIIFLAAFASISVF